MDSVRRKNFPPSSFNAMKPQTCSLLSRCQLRSIEMKSQMLIKALGVILLAVGVPLALIAGALQISVP